MPKIDPNTLNIPIAGFVFVGLTVAIGLGAISGAIADETDAKNLLKAMSDYVSDEDVVSFDFDATLDVVTNEDQRLGLASSGSVSSIGQARSGSGALAVTLTSKCSSTARRSPYMATMPTSMPRSR